MAGITAVTENNRDSVFERSTRDSQITRSFQAQLDTVYPINMAHELVRLAMDDIGFTNPTVHVGSIHPVRPTYVCTGINIKQVGDNRLLFEAQARYENRNGDLLGQDEATVENPLLRTPKVDIRFQTVRIPRERDLTYPIPKTFVNSTGAPYDPPIETDAIYPVLSVVKNEGHNWTTGQMFAKLQTYCGTVNSTEYLGAEPETLRVFMEASRQSENGYNFWTVSYEFTYRHDKWSSDGVILDAGFMEYTYDHERKGADGEWLQVLVPITFPPTKVVDGVKGYECEISSNPGHWAFVPSNEMEPVTQIWPMDGAGHGLSKAAIEAGFFHYHTYEVNRKTDFSGLGLDNIP